MSKQELAKMQTCVLRVNIQCHCDGCKQKIKKLLQKIDGVYTTTVDVEQGKVSVTGNVEPVKLIKKLEKSGKHAELWKSQKGPNNYQNILNNQFKSMQIDVKGGGGQDNKSQKGGKGQQHHQQIHQMTNVKGFKDLKAPPQKEQKHVKFNLNHHEDDFGASDDGFDDDEFDDDDLGDDDFDDDEEEFAHGHQGHGHGHRMPNQMLSVMGNGHGPNVMVNGPLFNNKKGGGGGGGGGNGKKGGDFEIPMSIKGNKNDGKNGKGGKKSQGGSGDGKKGEKSKQKQDGKDKKESKKSGGIASFLGFGKKSKNGREDDAAEKSKKGTNNFSGSNNYANGTKKGGGNKNDGPHEFGINNKMKSKYPQEKDVNFNGNSTKGMNHMGGHMMGGPMGMGGQMGGAMSNFGGNNNMGYNVPAVQGLPMQLQSGYYQNPYNNNTHQQQQQYMAMMMNQQMQNGNDMYHPMMYARQHPPMNYMAAPPMMPPPHSGGEPITHYFSDENANSCSVM